MLERGAKERRVESEKEDEEKRGESICLRGVKKREEERRGGRQRKGELFCAGV